MCEKIQPDYATRYLGKHVSVVVDRPLGSQHPTHGWRYALNYGRVPDTKAPDGEKIDAYVLGIDQPIKRFEGRCVAVIRRASDDDEKLVVVPEGKTASDDEIKSATHFQEQFFDVRIIRG